MPLVATVSALFNSSGYAKDLLFLIYIANPGLTLDRVIGVNRVTGQGPDLVYRKYPRGLTWILHRITCINII